jgi:hypothetical protein
MKKLKKCKSLDEVEDKNLVEKMFKSKQFKKQFKKIIKNK